MLSEAVSGGVEPVVSARLPRMVHDQVCGPRHPHAVPHSRPHRGLATAALALVCPHPATPAGSMVAPG